MAQDAELPAAALHDYTLTVRVFAPPATPASDTGWSPTQRARTALARIDACLTRVSEIAAGSPTVEESEMLQGVLEPRENSRLTCQIKVTVELDGIVINLPESQL